jgi:aldehyde:ferredoxin oxidoreductase
MPHGYTGRILRADLSAGKLSTEEPGESFYRQYYGGESFVAYFLLKEVPRGIDPFSPQNRLVFAAGPLTGIPVGGCGRHSIGAKSPLTGGFGEAEAGGYWGAELKRAGFDAIVVEGKSESPVYLYLNDGKAELRDARHLWGKKTLDCEMAIREELGDQRIKCSVIGPSGENLVRFACITNDLDAFAGRCGLGAVMGSKNLKAVACRGNTRIAVSDPQTISEFGKWVRDFGAKNLQAYQDYGTAANVMILNDAGGLPTLNFKEGVFDRAEEISGQTMADTILVKRRSCFACPVHCKREVAVSDPFEVDPRYGGPEYETIGAFGSNCGIGDLKAIAKANELCNAYGVDTISCGMAISFAMECFENGVLSTSDTDGIDLRFGNVEAMLQMTEKICLRQGFGRVLAEGTRRAAEEIGRGAEEFAIHIKGQEPSMHEPRLKQGLGVGFAMSPTGADHCHNLHDTAFSSETSPLLEDIRTLGIQRALPVNDLSPAKIQLLGYVTQWMHFLNSAVCCFFVVEYGRIGYKRMSDLMNAATGWNTSVFELMKVGERAMNMARVFNLREGFTAKDDTLPKRFHEAFIKGPLKGVVVGSDRFEKAKQAYYELMGWPEGVPTKTKLGELGIEWAEDAIG